jgi:hypothetical protein
MARVELSWNPFDIADPGPCIDVIVTNSRDVIEVMEEGNTVGLEYPKPVKIKALLDTGASITIISKTYANYCKLFQTGEGAKIAAIGATHVGVEHAGAISFPGTDLRSFDPIRIISGTFARDKLRMFDWGIIYMSPSPSFSTHALPCGLAAWLPLSLASVYRPKPRPQLRLVPSEFSCDQPRISQPFSADCSNETIESFEGVILDVPFIQPPCKLTGVASKMLRAYMVKGAVNSALQDGPNRLDRVSACRASGVFSRAVIHGFMFEKQPVKVREHNAIIGIELRPKFDVAVNPCCDGLHGAFVHRAKKSAAITFPHSKHSSFSDRPTASAELLMLMLVRFLATYETLVKLYDAFQLGNHFRGTASLTQTMQDEPRRFLSDTYLFGELKAADALPRCYEQVHRIEPFMQWDFAALEDRAGANGEVEIAASVAAVEANPLAGSDTLPAFAVRAANAVRPQARLQIEPRCILIGKRLKELEGADCGTGHLCRLAAIVSIQLHLCCDISKASHFFPARGTYLFLYVMSPRRIKLTASGGRKRIKFMFVGDRINAESTCLGVWAAVSVVIMGNYILKSLAGERNDDSLTNLQGVIKQSTRMGHCEGI